MEVPSVIPLHPSTVTARAINSVKQAEVSDPTLLIGGIGRSEPVFEKYQRKEMEILSSAFAIIVRRDMR
jgi:hypothetical protein